jgi:hypothetical protein
MAETNPTTDPKIPVDRTERLVDVAAITIPTTRLRDADLDVGELAQSIRRQGLQQRIGVKRAVEGGGFVLIWGRRRLEAYRKHPELLGTEVPAVIYPSGLPAAWARVLEIDENARRQDLTPDERAAHAVELAAELKSLEGKGVNSDKSDFSGSPAPTTGRGHKGTVQKVAERQRVDQATVRKRAQKVAETIGEPVDLDKDPPAELTRKAEKFRQASKDRPKRRVSRAGYVMPAKDKPKPPPSQTAIEGLVHLDAALDPRLMAELHMAVHDSKDTTAQNRRLREHLPSLLHKLKTIAGFYGAEAAEPAEPTLEAGQAVVARWMAEAHVDDVLEWLEQVFGLDALVGAAKAWSGAGQDQDQEVEQEVEDEVLDQDAEQVDQDVDHQDVEQAEQDVEQALDEDQIRAGIRALMEAGKPQLWIAEQSDVSRPTLRKFIRGEPVSPAIVTKLATLLQ